MERRRFLKGILLGVTALCPVTVLGSRKTKKQPDISCTMINFDGTSDHVTIYNRSLSPSEIKSLYTDPFQMFSVAS